MSLSASHISHFDPRHNAKKEVPQVWPAGPPPHLSCGSSEIDDSRDHQLQPLVEPQPSQT